MLKVLSLHFIGTFQISKIIIVVQKLHDTGGKFSFVEGFVAACSHNLPIIYKWLGPALGSEVKYHCIIEHNVSIHLKHKS